MAYLEGLPLPKPHIDYNPFWEGCRQGELLIQRCSDCGWYRHFPRPLCPKCHSWKANWERVSGKGNIWSWTVITQPIHSAIADKVPYNIVEVELIEQAGLRLISNLIDCRNEDIFIGMPVEVAFERMNEEITLPRFRRAAPTA